MVSGELFARIVRFPKHNGGPLQRGRITVGPDLADAERVFLNDVVNEVDSTGLGVFLVDLERSNPCRVINGCEPDVTNFLAMLSAECQELDVHLIVVAGNLFVVSLGMYLA